ncbi:MAG: carboxymuconolactone decarboxylase family protein [Solirubrobacteraceae bacterium]
MPRIEPVPPTPDGNPFANSLLARTMARAPEVLNAFARLDNAVRFKGRLPLELKEAVRRATAGRTGCRYCATIGGNSTPDATGRRESLAVAFAEIVATDAASVDDATFDVLREDFSEEEIVELVAWITLVAIGGQLFGATMGLEEAGEQEAAAYSSALAELAARQR